jgi:putative endonuclease
MNARGQLGVDGEDAAVAYLEANGYRIVERNFRCERGELDIVAERAGTIIFCEVKTRSTDRWGHPSEAVNHQKRARIRRLAAHWLLERGARPAAVRFDVISSVAHGASHRLTHIEDAF